MGTINYHRNHRSVQVALNTRIPIETDQILRDFVSDKKASIASVVDEALQEYIKRRRQEKTLSDSGGVVQDGE